MKKRFIPPTTPGARFKPPQAVFGRTGGTIEGIHTRKAETLHQRFRGRSR